MAIIVFLALLIGDRRDTLHFHILELANKLLPTLHNHKYLREDKDTVIKICII